YRTRFSLRPVFLADNVAVMPGSEMTDTGIFIDQFESIRSDINIAAFQVAGHRRSGAHIRATIFLVPSRPGKYLEIDVLHLPDVFCNRRLIHEHGWYRLKRFHLRIPPAHGFTLSQFGRATMNQLLPLSVVEHVGHQAHTARITFDRVKQQDRTIFPRADHSRQRTDLKLAIRALYQLEMAHLLHRRQIFAQIFKRSWTAFSGYWICHSCLLLPLLHPPPRNAGEERGGASSLLT